MKAIAIPVLLAVALMMALARFGGGVEMTSGHSIAATPGVPRFHVEIDIVQDGDTFCNPVGNSGTEAVGSTYRVAVCATDIPSAIGSFSFDLLYDKTLNECVEPANNDQGEALDDNPDANVGTTVWPAVGTNDNLGGDWDCSGFGLLYPACDRDLPDDPPNLGRARIVCISLDGPWTLGDDETEGALATMRFKVIGTGADTLHLENVHVADKDGAEIGSCNPAIWVPIPCFDATDDKTAPPATPTPAPVGGIAELPGLAAASSQEAGGPREDPGWSVGDYAALAGGVAVVAAAIAAGGWYARRRWLR